MLQTLARRDDVAELTTGYGLVVVDECHHIPAAAFEDVVKQIQARRWLGLTATPYRRDRLDDLIALQLGPVRHAITSQPTPPGQIPEFAGQGGPSVASWCMRPTTATRVPQIPEPRAGWRPSTATSIELGQGADASLRSHPSDEDHGLVIGQSLGEPVDVRLPLRQHEAVPTAAEGLDHIADNLLEARGVGGAATAPPLPGAGADSTTTAGTAPAIWVRLDRFRSPRDLECNVNGCDRPQDTRGWCANHYQRWRKTGDTANANPPAPRPTECTVDGCDRKPAARGWCFVHYHRWRRAGDPGPAGLRRIPRRTGCSVEGCDRPHSAKGMCHLHYCRWRATGEVGPVGRIERPRKSLQD